MPQGALVPVEGALLPVEGAYANAVPHYARVVPEPAYWTTERVKMADGRTCRKPPPYAACKPELPRSAAPVADKPVLTAALARQHASADNMLIVTYINYNRVNFALTWVRHLQAEKQPHHLVAALDAKALAVLEARGVASYLLDFSTLDERDTGWGTDAFRKLGLFKVQMVLDLAKTGVDTLTVDADAFILRDPLPYFRRFPTADVLMSSDLLFSTRTRYNSSDDGLETARGFGAAFNIGFIFIRARAVEFVQAWHDECYRLTSAWDQNLFADTLRRGASLMPRDAEATPEGLQPMFRLQSGRHLLAGVLPVSLFASGHTYFVSRLAHRMRAVPYMVHTTFQYGGVQGKRHRLREAMMWEDDPEYFTVRMLRYEPNVPYKLVYPRGSPDRYGTVDFEEHMSVDEHFRLVHYQLRQLRDALALARALGRVLILPRLICGLDRYWAPHDGVIPGSATRLPLLECPADHVIDLERMRTPEASLREHSILCNPRMPAAVLEGAKKEALSGAGDRGGGGSAGGRGVDFAIDDRLGVSDDDVDGRRRIGATGGRRRACADRCGTESECRRRLVACDRDGVEAKGGEGGEGGGLRGEGGGLPGSAASALVRRLANVHNATGVLEISGVLPDYRATLGATIARDFENEVKSYASLWCCNRPPGGRGAGHVWYDFFADVTPRVDMHGRSWTQPWKQIMGP